MVKLRGAWGPLAGGREGGRERKGGQKVEVTEVLRLHPHIYSSAVATENRARLGST